MPIYRGVH